MYRSQPVVYIGAMTVGIINHCHFIAQFSDLGLRQRSQDSEKRNLLDLLLAQFSPVKCEV